MTIPFALPDPGVIRVCEALEVQSSALASVCRQLDGVLGRLPPPADAGWSGPAHDFFADGLASVAWVVGRASDRAHDALVATELAVQSLSGRVG